MGEGVVLIRLYLILLVSASDPQATRETAMAEIPTPLRYRKKNPTVSKIDLVFN